MEKHFRKYLTSPCQNCQDHENEERWRNSQSPEVTKNHDDHVQRGILDWILE